MSRVSISACDKCHKCDKNGLSLSSLLDPIRQPSIYRRGAALFMEGQPATTVFLICNGRIKHTLTSPYGKSFLVRLGSAGDVLGLSDCLVGEDYSGSATALVDSEISCISRRHFLELLDKNPDSAREITQLLARECRAVCDAVENIALVPSVKARLLHFLQGIRSKSGSVRRQIAFPYTQEELAEILGCTRETVGRLFMQLTRMGAITRKGASVTFAPQFDRIAGNAVARKSKRRCA